MSAQVFNNSGNLIAYPVGRDVNILTNDGICVASSNHKKVGSRFNLIKQKTLSESPLTFGSQKKALLLCDNQQYSENELALVKNLARVTLEQYMNTISKPLGTVDQFIAEVIERPFNHDNLTIFENEAKSLGFNLETKRVAIVVEIKNFTEDNLSNSSNPDYTREDVIQDWKNKIVSAISGFFTIKTDIISAYTGSDRFVFFKEIDGNVDRFIKPMKNSYLSIFGPMINPKNNNFSVGFSDCHTGTHGLYESYHEALQALNLGRKFIKNNNECYYYGDLGTLRILTEDDTTKKKSFAHEVLEPLSKETLRVTLETFLNENMDIKKTAAKLKVHPNTVNYRLTKIGESLGLDPRIFKQAFELRIALLTDRIFE